MALFGEKYGDKVRVLTLGRALDGDGAYSVELCGGTHVARTGDIALFKIVSEQGIAAGVRRIEALTGEAARRYLLEQAAVAKALADQFKAPVSDVIARVEALESQRRKLERDLAEAKRQLAVGGGAGPEAAVEEVNGVKFIGRVLQGVGGKDLRPIAETFRKQIPDGVVALNGVIDGKVANTVVVLVLDSGSGLDRRRRLRNALHDRPALQSLRATGQVRPGPGAEAGGGCRARGDFDSAGAHVPDEGQRQVDRLRHRLRVVETHRGVGHYRRAVNAGRDQLHLRA